jgi:hypothetical protein
MRRLIILVAVVVAAVGALAVHVTRSDARWHVLSGTAINDNANCSDGLRYTWAANQTDTQPPARRPIGHARFIGPIALIVQSAPTGTPNTDQDWFNASQAGADVFTAKWAPVFNPDVSSWYPYSHVGTVAYRHPLTPVTDSVRMDTQPNGDIASAAVEPVGNCVLFGRIDFMPGVSPNVVDFSHDSTPAVALLSNSGFNAASVAPKSVLFGATGTEAAPLAGVTKTDVNGDGRLDLKLRFRLSQTGLTCSTPEVMLSGIDPKSDVRFYETDTMQGTNCP